jgi:hypothetical protein
VQFLYPYRVFTLEQANAVIPRVAELTGQVQERLDELRQAYDEEDPDATQGLEAETRALLTGWQEDILEFGAEPKGIFTVDFRSPDPNVVWCWTASESQIAHRHFTWETFKDRVAIDGGKRAWPSVN